MLWIYSILMLCSSTAFADLKPFDQTEFVKSIQNKPRTVLMINAPWCGHCYRQRQVIDAISDQKPYSSYDFYKLSRGGENAIKASITKKYIQPYLKSQHKKSTCDLSTRSTIVVFHQSKVVACQAFITNEAKIKTLISQSK